MESKPEIIAPAIPGAEIHVQPGRVPLYHFRDPFAAKRKLEAFPDLLDACKRVEAWDFDLDGDCVAQAQEAARAVILKAEKGTET